MTLRRLPAESARPRPSRSLTPAQYEQGGRLEPLKDAGPCAASLNPGLEPIGSPLLPICFPAGTRADRLVPYRSLRPVRGRSRVRG